MGMHMGGSEDMPMGGSADGATDGMAGIGGMDGMGGAGSGNITAPCYANPSNPDCATFTRSDEDWQMDIEMLCEAMPFMVGCTLAEQCMSGAASGDYCEPSSLAGNLCVDMPKMKGCEAWNALCGANGTAVVQCTAPGPVPGVVTTFTAKSGIESLCSTHCMDGCPDCEQGKTWDTCAEPLLVLARMCYEMPDMPECLGAPSGTGMTKMCQDSAVAASFPLICTNPAVPDAKCP